MHKEIDKKGLTVSDECEYDPEKQFKYLGPSLQMRVLYNRERFDPTEYGDDKFVKESQISSMQFNPRSPSFVFLNLMMQEIEDETDLI